MLAEGYSYRWEADPGEDDQEYRIPHGRRGIRDVNRLTSVWDVVDQYSVGAW
jgi:hypothetical protein